MRAKVAELMPGVRDDLARLVRIPSVAFRGFPPEPVHDAARAVVELLAGAGVADARQLEIPGGYPAVYGEIAAPPGRLTVLLYAHYDVQPAGKPEAWSSPPFEPEVRGGRMYGRGAADDKSGVVSHAAALRAFGGQPPVGVRIIIEGEEETDSHLEEYVRTHPELFGADAMIVADAGNLRPGVPTLTTALRGIVACTVEVRTLAGPVHSGQFGGPSPDALMALVRILATLQDDRGNAAIAGLASGTWTGGAELDEERFRQTVGLVDGADLVGDGSLADRLWARPSINVIGIDAPPVAGAANALVPGARARVSLRVVPGEEPQRALQLLQDHLRAVAPWHAQVRVFDAAVGEGYETETDGPVYAAAKRGLAEAFGTPAITGGAGGSIPLVNVLASVAPGAEIVMWGAADGESTIHAPDESVDLADLERMILAEALLFAELGGAAG
ncbi:MAG: dipeptidase [Dehalococcoidia bacterium]|nr:MAG: dipeptidase [Dehalococcoidia bacterium]